jgi:hypothetical protein
MTTGLTDMLGNGRIAELEARHDVALMNLNHAFFSFAYAGAAMLTGFAREAEVAPSVWFTLIARRDPRSGDGRARQGLFRSRSSAGPERSARGPIGLHAWLAGGVVLVAFFVENSTEIWAALHIERTLGGGAAEGALGPAMLGLTMGTGRLLGHLVTSRGREPRVLTIAAWLSGGGLLLAAIAPGPLVAYLGFGLVGLGASVIAPLALALAGQAANPGGARSPSAARCFWATWASSLARRSWASSRTVSACARPSAWRRQRGRHAPWCCCPACSARRAETSGPARLEIRRQKQVVPPQIGHVAFAAQRHGRVEFLVDDLQRLGHAGLAHRAQTHRRRRARSSCPWPPAPAP